MKKFYFLGSSILTSLYGATTTLASHVQGHVDDPTNIQINRPKTAEGKPIGFSTIGDFITNVLILAFIIAVIAVLFMLIWGAFEWITSGGDKEAVGKARGRIINALIGLAVLSVAFALFQLSGQFLGFNVLDFKIPIPSR